MPVYEPEIALVHDFHGVGNRFGSVCEKGGHLFFGFKIELVAGESHAVGVVVVCRRLHAQKNVLRFRVFFIDVVHVVGRDEFDIIFLRVDAQVFVDFRLFGNTVILHFEIEIFSEQIFIP